MARILVTVPTLLLAVVAAASSIQINTEGDVTVQTVTMSHGAISESPFSPSRAYNLFFPPPLQHLNTNSHTPGLMLDHTQQRHGDHADESNSEDEMDDVKRPTIRQVYKASAEKFTIVHVRRHLSRDTMALIVLGLGLGWWAFISLVRSLVVAMLKCCVGDYMKPGALAECEREDDDIILDIIVSDDEKDPDAISLMFSLSSGSDKTKHEVKRECNVCRCQEKGRVCASPPPYEMKAGKVRVHHV
eukprot:comp15576_c0_seq1/m.12678 comp15576_c0_seq1/g.12678  ORF comp15576_c0_seq1/g.12678 comp15576_c0_seq1/m.12678 type:complete len:245 (-) comp15576_c0_seq1:555-1289(-)